MNVRVRKRMLRKYWERKCVQTRKKRGKKKREEEIKKKDAGHLGGMKSLRIRKQTPFASLLWEKRKKEKSVLIWEYWKQFSFWSTIWN